MEKTITKQFVTMQMALDRFVNDRLIGNVPLAMQQGSQQCQYDPNFNGGCAIGCWLGDVYKSGMEGRTVSYLFHDFPYLEQMFEAPGSQFWQKLQNSHDYIGDWQWEFLQAVDLMVSYYRANGKGKEPVR